MWTEWVWLLSSYAAETTIFTNSADHLNMIKILSLQTKYSVSHWCAIWTEWIIETRDVQWTGCHVWHVYIELMHARYGFDVCCFIMLLVDWHSVLFALCSFQCSQMAMTVDDETEYFVCSDKILIIFKWSAELVKSSFQLHMTPSQLDNNHTHSVHIVHILGALVIMDSCSFETRFQITRLQRQYPWC